MEIFELTIHELHEKLQKKELSAVEATTALLSRIKATDEKINAFISVTEEAALESAAAADARIAAGAGDILTGIPIALKDIFLTTGIRTTCGSKILKNFIPPYDSTAWGKLQKRGAVLLGKLNLHEFAYGGTSVPSHFGAVPRPVQVLPVAASRYFGATLPVLARS